MFLYSATFNPYPWKSPFAFFNCYAIIKIQRNNRPQGVDQITQIELPPSLPAKYTRVVFLYPFLGFRKNYLRLFRIKVSNARWTSQTPLGLWNRTSYAPPPIYVGWKANALAVTRLFPLLIIACGKSYHNPKKVRPNLSPLSSQYLIDFPL